ncbi:MAG: hemolysin family protein [Micrococcales bacterium]|nr:hemolysin family protein [Micrococcales bacterium]
MRLQWWLVVVWAVATGVLVVAVISALAASAVGRRWLTGSAGPAPGLEGHSRLSTLATALARPWLALARGIGASQSQGLTAEQLAELVENVSTTEEIEDEDREMLSSVAQLGQQLTRELMVPRTEVVAIEADKPLRKAMSLFLRSGHSRVPVVGPEGLDDVRGLVYLKDVALVMQAQADAAGSPVADHCRPVVFVPESKPADDLLRELQAMGTHMVMVVDEYGGVAGLVTLEDVLEEIVGELTDEHDPTPLEATDMGDGFWRVPTRWELDQLGELFDLEIDDEDVDTVGGLLAKAAGRVPIAGTKVEVSGLELAAERFEGRRKQVSTVLARRLQVDPAAGQ